MKLAGSYQSIVRGVSEQVPQDRRPGQHHEQVNLISDPVRGLARRYGSILQAEATKTTNYISGDWAARVADMSNHDVLPFQVDGVEYDLIYRRKAVAGGYAYLAEDSLMAYNKTTKQFIPVVFNTSDAAAINELITGGVASAVNLGVYVLLAGNTMVPTVTQTNRWFATGAKKFGLWARGPAYNREFTVELIRADGSKIVASYKTPSSGYPGTLSTSDIAASDPEYNKKVNDRVNAYNSAVTAWITTAAEGASPEGIINGLKTAISDECFAAGLTPPTLSAFGSFLNIRSYDTGAGANNFVEISANDAGDGSLLRAVGQTIDGLEAVSPKHWANHIVRVKPKNATDEEVTYLKAVPKSAEISTTFPIDVTWQECAGVEVSPTKVFIYGTVHNGTLVLGSTKAYIDAKATEVLGSTFTGTPAFLPSIAGDLTTDPLPKFLKDKISYLGLFQDRLVIGSGSTIFMSKPGDYFNWFRKSTLTVADDDPIELLAYGSETDIIRASTTYDRSLVLHGEQFQYTINGRVPATPKTAAIIIMSAHEDTVDAKPKNSGNFVYYGRVYNGRATMHQIQTGVVAESPESYEITQQLDTYLQGTPVQIVTTTAPNHVFLRTDTYKNGVYVYTYLDNAAGAERLFDAWSRWEWDADKVGNIIGMSTFHGDLLVYTVKHGLNSAGVDKVWISAELFRTETDLSPLPYMDSLRKQESLSGTGFLNANTPPANVAFAFDNTTSRYMLGLPAERQAELATFTAPERATLWAGVLYKSSVTPTNPYPRDSNDKAITTGRMTLGQVVPTLANTGGLKVTLQTTGGDKVVLERKARVLGFDNNLIGRQPITDYVERVMIGKEVRDCKYKLEALSWLPLTISSIEWVGQFFNNVKRM